MDWIGAGLTATPIRSGPLRRLERGGEDDLKGVDAAREVFDAAREAFDAARKVLDAAREAFDAAREVCNALRVS